MVKNTDKKKPAVKNTFFTSKPFKFLLVGLFLYFLSHAVLLLLTIFSSQDRGESAKVAIISEPGLHVLANQDPTMFDLNQDGVDDHIFGYGCYRLEPSQHPNILREDYSRKKELGFTCERESDYATSVFTAEYLVFVASKDGKTYMYNDGLYSNAKVFTDSGWQPTTLPSDLYWGKTLQLSYADVKNGSYGLPWFYAPIHWVSYIVHRILYFFSSLVSPSLAAEFIIFLVAPILVDIFGMIGVVVGYFRSKSLSR